MRSLLQENGVCKKKRKKERRKRIGAYEVTEIKINVSTNSKAVAMELIRNSFIFLQFKW